MNGLLQSHPRSLRAHAAASVLAVSDEAMDGLDDESYQLWFDLTFAPVYLLEAEEAQPPSQDEPEDGRLADDIGEVREEEVNRYVACTQLAIRGIRCRCRARH